MLDDISIISNVRQFLVLVSALNNARDLLWALNLSQNQHCSFWMNPLQVWMDKVLSTLCVSFANWLMAAKLCW